MSASSATRRAIAEIDFGDGANVSFKIGNRSIHQFWHLFSSHFRHVLLAPQRRADSGKVAWTWREAGEKRPVTATELVEVRRRLSEANRSLAGGFGGMGRRDDEEASSLEGQVRASVGEMVDQLLAQRDPALAGFVCRTDAGLMLHSWGAAVAAQPHFPDAQQCEISGTVFVGVERAASVTVVLENTQGIGGARVKSDQEGVFRFRSVAPGSYHLRVADRSDFPAGLTVEIERESIAGLELRSTSDEPLAMAGKTAPMPEDIPWFRRGWAAVVLVVLVLGGGTMAWWWSKRSSAAPAVAQNQSSSWQSAKGQLAANNAQTPTNDDHKVGQEGGFSNLSNSIPPPKILHPRRDHVPSEAEGVASDHAAQPSEDSAVSAQRIPEENKPAADSSGKAALRTTTPLQVTRDPLNRRSAAPEENVRAANDASGAVSEGDEPKPAKDQLAKFSLPKVDKKKDGTPGASSPVSDESPDEDAASAGTNAAPDAATSSAPGSKVGKSSPRGGAKVPMASGAAENAEAAGSNADAGAPDSPTPGASAAANGQSKPNPGKKAKESTKGTAPNGAAATSVDSVVPDSVANTPDGSTSPEARSGQGASKNQPSKKIPPANQATAQADSSPPPDQADAASGPVPPTTAPSAKPPKRPPAAMAGKSAPAAPANEQPVSPSEAEADAADAPSPDPAVNRPSRKQSKAGKKSTPAQSSQAVEPPQSSGAESSTDLSTIIPGLSAATVTPENEGPLVRIEKVHASVWKKRMVRDVIVPTRPVTEAEEERMDALRENLRREQATRLPKAFQPPRMSGGLVVEFAATLNKQNPPRWRDGSGAEPAGSSVSGRRTELTWSGGVPPANMTYTLNDSDGRVLAVAIVDGDGGITLKTRAKSNSWYWCGIERTPARSTDARTADAGAPFDWKLLSGLAIPASWTLDDHWLDGRGQRLEIPLDATTKRVGNYQIALIDPVTGWALVSDVACQ